MYQLPEGQSNSLALSNMPPRMNGLDTLSGSDTYNRLRANLLANAPRLPDFRSGPLKKAISNTVWTHRPYQLRKRL